MASAAPRPHVHVHPRTRGRTPATIAEQAEWLEGRKPQHEHKQLRLLAALGDGGHLTWTSSPTVMWLADRLERGL